MTHYEIHVTVGGPAFTAERFRTACAAIGVKPVLLDLQTRAGAVLHDAMTSSRVVGDDQSAMAEARRVVRELEELALPVLRVKVEADPWHPRAPQGRAHRMPAGSYFEAHVQAAVPRGENHDPALTGLCEQFGAHRSRNVFKAGEDGDVFMLTLRERCGLQDFAPRVAGLRACLRRLGLAGEGRSEIEFVVYDSKESHDAAWLT